ncbi:hypothetical protein B0T20DRAFT_69499 [Sordaria brevicollis]|uniref:Uncharacterized protein n=1 Tax=Sordaria brevicollis TaxID=83679 RepID=A0AAE0U689_SORBR|nr:hypothetical protein B0T20DRAFT_69499 [Sordaria brevicollis]
MMVGLEERRKMQRTSRRLEILCVFFRGASESTFSANTVTNSKILKTLNPNSRSGNRCHLQVPIGKTRELPMFWKSWTLEGLSSPRSTISTTRWRLIYGRVLVWSSLPSSISEALIHARSTKCFSCQPVSWVLDSGALMSESRSIHKVFGEREASDRSPCPKPVLMLCGRYNFSLYPAKKQSAVSGFTKDICEITDGSVLLPEYIG